MEKPELENARYRKELPMKMEKLMIERRTQAVRLSGEVKLAAVAVDLNVRLRSTDMPAGMQERAIRYARILIDTNRENQKPNSTRLAMCLKKEFDSIYGPAWQCIVGKSFGSFVTHSTGGFIYFTVDNFSFLLFKTAVRPVVKLHPPLLTGVDH